MCALKPFIQLLTFSCIFLHRECHIRAFEIHKKLFGPKHPAVASVLGNLGIMWEEVGDQANAISLYQKALAIQQEILGFNHPELRFNVVKVAE